MSLFDFTLSPHRRAERLMSARADAAREGAAAEVAWLGRHLAACPRCRAYERHLELALGALGELRDVEAPVGFAGRVMLAAKARGRAEEATPHEVSPAGAGRSYAFAGLAMVLAVGAFVAVAPLAKKEPGQGVELAGRGAAAGGETAHFTVRSPGSGPARARAQITELLEAHGAGFSAEGGVLTARVPRARLVPLLQDLAKKSRFKVSKGEDRELPPELEVVVVRFELE